MIKSEPRVVVAFFKNKKKKEKKNQNGNLLNELSFLHFQVSRYVILFKFSSRKIDSIRLRSKCRNNFLKKNTIYM